MDRKYDFSSMSVVNLSLICQLGVVAPSTPLISLISFSFFFYYCALAWPWQSMTIHDRGDPTRLGFWCYEPDVFSGVFEKKYSTCHRRTRYTTWMTWNTVCFKKKQKKQPPSQRAVTATIKYQKAPVRENAPQTSVSLPTDRLLFPYIYISSIMVRGLVWH